GLALEGARVDGRGAVRIAVAAPAAHAGTVVGEHLVAGVLPAVDADGVAAPAAGAVVLVGDGGDMAGGPPADDSMADLLGGAVGPDSLKREVQHHRSSVSVASATTCRHGRARPSSPSASWWATCR